jgi:hypothetical protein
MVYLLFRVRQWTGDTRGWYKNGGQPLFTYAGASYVFIYAMVTLGFIVLMLGRGSCFHWWTLGSSQHLHSKMVHK